MKQALEKKDADLAGAQNVAKEKTELAEKRLASVDKLEKENETLKTSVEEVKKEAAQLKDEKVTLTDKGDQLTRKRGDLEAYLGSLAKKLYIMLDGNLSRSSEFCYFGDSCDAATDSYFPFLCRILPKF